jgi:hypothetical protein
VTDRIQTKQTPADTVRMPTSLWTALVGEHCARTFDFLTSLAYPDANDDLMLDMSIPDAPRACCVSGRVLRLDRFERRDRRSRRSHPPRHLRLSARRREDGNRTPRASTSFI